MKTLIALAALLLFGCGLETAGSAATTGKLQADEAKQAKESLDAMKTSLDAASKEADAKNRALEEAAAKN
ncbi:MAG: hypothetical protein HGA71_14115 [Azonexaceae bacterium]|nr:hypothetical protein [Azonexaceae bacterium]